MQYNEIGRYGSYGIAKQKSNELDVPDTMQCYIFKDITNGPFTSFKSDSYVLAVGEKKYNDIETEEQEHA